MRGRCQIQPLHACHLGPKGSIHGRATLGIQHAIRKETAGMEEAGKGTQTCNGMHVRTKRRVSLENRHARVGRGKEHGAPPPTPHQSYGARPSFHGPSGGQTAKRPCASRDQHTSRKRHGTAAGIVDHHLAHMTGLGHLPQGLRRGTKAVARVDQRMDPSLSQEAGQTLQGMTVHRGRQEVHSNQLVANVCTFHPDAARGPNVALANFAKASSRGQDREGTRNHARRGQGVQHKVHATVPSTELRKGSIPRTPDLVDT
mmetsp:Transcript_5696/g.35434  ORF Transcript_5696/g.35434 Transcript_5696/m.35434 type:complete len:258 (+) Transcript_5696:2189-2962(+)